MRSGCNLHRVSTLLLVHFAAPHILCSIETFAVRVAESVPIDVTVHARNKVVLEGSLAGEGFLANGIFPLAGLRARLATFAHRNVVDGWGD